MLVFLAELESSLGEIEDKHVGIRGRTCRPWVLSIFGFYVLSRRSRERERNEIERISQNCDSITLVDILVVSFPEEIGTNRVRLDAIWQSRDRVRIDGIPMFSSVK